MKLVFGLGNPEPEYSWTRHNIGKEVLNIASPIIANETSWNSHKIGGSNAIQTPDVILIKPGGYMNDVGNIVSQFVSYYDISSDDVSVVYDELDLEVEKYKFKQGGGSKIHNGILSIQEHLKSRDFWHLRVGVRDPEIKMSVQRSGRDPSKYVISKFDIPNKNQLVNLIENSLVVEITN